MKKRSSTMVRKHILIPPKLIAKIESIAKDASIAENKRISFSEIIRRALSNYNSTPSISEEMMLEALLDSVILSTNETVKRNQGVRNQGVRVNLPQFNGYF